MAMVVEFVGAPAAGKTLLMRGLSGRRPSGGGRVVPISDVLTPPRRGVPRPIGRRLARPVEPERLRRALAERATEWDAFLRLAAGADPGDVPPLRRLQGLVWTLQTLELLAAAADRPPREVIVLDEGPLQRALALLDPAASDGEVARFVAAAPPTDLVVHVVSDAPSRSRRLAARAASGRRIGRYAGLDAAGRAETSRADAALLARVVAATRTAGRRVVEVDGSDGATAATADVLAVLRTPGDG